MDKNAQKTQDILIQKGLPFEVIELPTSTRTAKEAAFSIGCEEGQIVKSLVFQLCVSKKPVMVLASGINRVNEKTIKNIINEAVVKADADFTKKITGFTIGGVSPIGHKEKIEHIFIDEDLLKYEQVWAAAGTFNSVFSIASSLLKELTGGIVCSIK